MRPPTIAEMFNESGHMPPSFARWAGPAKLVSLAKEIGPPVRRPSPLSASTTPRPSPLRSAPGNP